MSFPSRPPISIILISFQIRMRPTQIVFQPFRLPPTSPQPPLHSSPLDDDHFSAEDREHLKNAFRYICRLVFKEASRHQSQIRQMAHKLGVQQNKPLGKLFEKAEEISGERYFRKYLSSFEAREQQLICDYMVWFLQHKYLRYLGEEGKGKRKQMKKSLYVRFKNQIMLPYLRGFS